MATNDTHTVRELDRQRPIRTASGRPVDLLTVRQGAEYIGVSIRTFRHLLAMGRIARRQYVPRGKVLVPRADLDRFVRESPIAAVGASQVPP